MQTINHAGAHFYGLRPIKFTNDTIGYKKCPSTRLVSTFPTMKLASYRAQNVSEPLVQAYGKIQN